MDEEKNVENEDQTENTEVFGPDDTPALETEPEKIVVKLEHFCVTTPADLAAWSGAAHEPLRGRHYVQATPSAAADEAAKGEQEDAGE